MSKSGKAAADRAWATIRRKKEKHESYLRRTDWIRQRSVFLRPFLIDWKKESVRHSDRCVVCGESMPNTLHTHHLDGNNRNNDGENKVILCGSCHIIIHKAKSDKEALHDFEERHKRASRTPSMFRTHVSHESDGCSLARTTQRDHTYRVRSSCRKSKTRKGRASRRDLVWIASSFYMRVSS